MRSVSAARLASLVLVIATMAGPASAQYCLGRPAFAKNGPQAGGHFLSFPESVNEYGLDVGFGTKQGMFASGGVAVTSLGGNDGHAKSVNGLIGESLTRSGSPVDICPTAGVSYLKFPTTVGVESHTLSGTIGASIGAAFGSDPQLKLVPFGGVYYEHQSFSASGFGITESDKFNNGRYVAGFSIVSNGQLAVGAMVENVFAVEHTGRALFGVFLSFNFGD